MYNVAIDMHNTSVYCRNNKFRYKLTIRNLKYTCITGSSHNSVVKAVDFSPSVQVLWTCTQVIDTISKGISPTLLRAPISFYMQVMSEPF